MKSIPFYKSVDFKKHETRGLVIQRLYSEPTNPVEGQVYYHREREKFLGWTGEKWEVLNNKSTFRGIVGDIETGAPSNPELNDIVALTTPYGLKLFIFDGSEWQTTYDLKEYIDEQVKWGIKEF